MRPQYTIKRARSPREKMNSRGQTMATDVPENQAAQKMSDLAEEHPNVAGTYYAINTRTGEHYPHTQEVKAQDTAQNPKKKKRKKK